MALSTLASNSTTLVADNLEELHKILSDKYSEQGLAVSRFARSMRAKGNVGLHFLTPAGMINRLNDWVSKQKENIASTSPDLIETFRVYSEVVLLVVPQIPKHMAVQMSLSLIDTGTMGTGLPPIQETTITLTQPHLVIFRPYYSIPNQDRVGKDHRRIALMHSCEATSPLGPEVSPAVISAVWNRSISMQPAFYQDSKISVVPIIVNSTRDMKMLIASLMRTGDHARALPQISGSVNLTARPQPQAIDANQVSYLPKGQERQRHIELNPSERTSTTRPQTGERPPVHIDREIGERPPIRRNLQFGSLPHHYHTMDQNTTPAF